jgi:hypothetical protein
MTLNDRMYYLAQSLASAKSAASVGAEDVEFTSSLQERIDVASVQMEVERAIENHESMSGEEKKEAMGQIDNDLIGLDEVSFSMSTRPLGNGFPFLGNSRIGDLSPITRCSVTSFSDRDQS